MTEVAKEIGRTPALSLVFPYYENPRMLIRHLVVFRHEWSPELRDAVEVIIVDDGSPHDRAADVVAELWNGDRAGLPAISVYRITEDRPWNQHAARNVGAHVAKAETLMLTDVDHVVPPSTLTEILRALPLGKREVLTFGRVDAPSTLTWHAEHWREFARTRRDDGSLKPHVNSMALNREHFWAIGAYDEDYAGIYGCDREFRIRLFASGTTVRHLHAAPLIRVGRDVIEDASTRGVDRKVAGRNRLKKAVKIKKAVAGRADRTLTLASPWERAA